MQKTKMRNPFYEGIRKNGVVVDVEREQISLDVAMRQAAQNLAEVVSLRRRRAKATESGSLDRRLADRVRDHARMKRTYTARARVSQHMHHGAAFAPFAGSEMRNDDVVRLTITPAEARALRAYFADPRRRRRHRGTDNPSRKRARETAKSLTTLAARDRRIRRRLR